MCTLALRPDKPLFDLGHRKPSIRRCTAALSPSVTYIIPIIAGPLSAGLLVSGCFLRSHVIKFTGSCRCCIGACASADSSSLVQGGIGPRPAGPQSLPNDKVTRRIRPWAKYAARGYALKLWADNPDDTPVNVTSVRSKLLLASVLSVSLM
jgi:hypothetical protein